MRPQKWLLHLLAATLLIVAAPGEARAGYVFLNGVPVTGMKNQKFEGCKVVFDANGNVQITAPGIKIKAMPQAGAAAPQPAPPPPRAAVPTPPPPTVTPPPAMTSTPSAPPPRPVVNKPPPKPEPKKEDPPPPPRTGPLTQRYFLVAIPTSRGVAQYDINIFINGQHAKKVRNRVSQLTFEVTKWLKWGRNKVQFAATKNLDGKPRRSRSPGDFMRIVIGPGLKGGGTVKLDEILADFRAPASKTANFGVTQTVDLK